MELNFNVRETDIEKVRISPFQTKTIYHLASDHFRHNVLRKPTADVLGVLPLTLSAPPPHPWASHNFHHRYLLLSVWGFFQSHIWKPSAADEHPWVASINE